MRKQRRQVDETRPHLATHGRKIARSYNDLAVPDEIIELAGLLTDIAAADHETFVALSRTDKVESEGPEPATQRN